MGRTLVVAGWFVGVFVQALLRGALSAPVTTPSFDTCRPVDYSQFVTGPPNGAITCCPPLPMSSVKKFKLPKVSSDTPLRVRPAMQCADEKYVKKLTKAYKLMRELPSSDPRSLVQQGNLHCAYCGGAFKVPGTNDTGIDVHFSWLFFPWHRAFIYFHERILQSLLKDPTFSLPFWNWDNQLESTYAAGDNKNCFLPGNKVPEAYITEESLAVPRGYGFNLANISTTNIKDAIWDASSPLISDWNEYLRKPKSEQVASNLYLMFQAVVAPNDALTFLGAPINTTSPRASPNFHDAYKGAVEMGPHVAAHLWARGLVDPWSQSYGNWNAAQDPLFFANHGNIDRLWSVWRKLGGPKRQDLTDPDWLDAEFKFYDENADLISVKISDILDTDKLGYRYQPVADAWANYNHAPICSKVSSSKLKKIISDTKEGVPKDGIKALPSSGFQTVLARPSKAVGRDHDAAGFEERLVVEGIKISTNVPTDFAVFMNAPDIQGTNSQYSCAEFLGRFGYTPTVGGPSVNVTKRSFSLRSSIGKKLELMGVNQEKKLLISVYPLATGLNIGSTGQQGELATISFKDMYIEMS